MFRTGFEQNRAKQADEWNFASRKTLLCAEYCTKVRSLLLIYDDISQDCKEIHKMFSAFDANHPLRTDLQSYGLLLQSIVCEGLTKWNEEGILDKMNNSGQLCKVIEQIRKTGSVELSDEMKEKLLHDLRSYFDFH